MRSSGVVAILLSLTASLCLASPGVFADAFSVGRAQQQQQQQQQQRVITSIATGGSQLKQQQQQPRRRRYTSLFSTSSKSAVDTPIDKKKQVNSVENNNNNNNNNKIVNVDKTTTSLKQSQNNNKTTPLTFLKSMDGIVFLTYLCNVVALSLPVILLPMAASEYLANMMSDGGVSYSATNIAATVAAVSSIATLGGAFGKFCNGFICKELGSYFCSKVYLFGLGICSLLFSMSTTSTTLGMSLAGMEFFASMQWASLSVMLSNYYSKDKMKLAAALTTLGLSSTTGMVLAKTLGTSLGTAFHWKLVARFGAVMALLGSIVISQAPGNEKNKSVSTNINNNNNTEKKVPVLQSIQESLQAILTSPLFWFLGLAHSMAFCTRGTERILGTFYNHVAGLPQSIAGGLTLSITFGLMYGLVTGSRKFSALAGQPQQQKAFLASRYRKSFAATLGLAFVASPLGSSLFKNNIVTAGIVALLSGTMISNVAFQYYQFPAMIARKFGQHKAVCISFLDGFGFLLSAPIFATCSKLVPTAGWTSAWSMLAVLFGLAGVLMVKQIGPILQTEPASSEE